MERIVIFGNLRLEKYEMIIVVGVRGRIGGGGFFSRECMLGIMHVCVYAYVDVPQHTQGSRRQNRAVRAVRE